MFSELMYAVSNDYRFQGGIPSCGGGDNKEGDP